MKRFLAVLFSVLLTISLASAETMPADGIYEGTARGMGGDVVVNVTIAGNAIINVTVIQQNETAGIADPALEQIPAKIVEANSTGVDIVTGCTVTSNAIIEAVKAALGENDAASGPVTYVPGTYTASANGMNAPIEFSVTVSDHAIESIDIVSHQETRNIGTYALEVIPADIIKYQSLDIDMVSGATITSQAIMSGVTECLKLANANLSALKAARERNTDIQTEYAADLVIIGGGGAGLTAAATALEEGASVVLIESTDILGGNSLVVGGLMNAPIPELQDYALAERSASMESLVLDALNEAPVSEAHKALQDAVRADYEAYLASDKTMFDSANWFALQSWNSGDKLGDIEMIKILASSAYDRMQWLIENGMKFQDKVVLGGGALYTRSRYAVEPNGVGYIDTLKRIIEENDKGNLTILMGTRGTELIVTDGKVTGAKAIDRKTGKEITLNAGKAVILTTGGFAGNVELRQKYCEGEKWKDLGPSVGTTNLAGVRGDGIFMASAVGAELVNMDQIQLLPYCNPQTGFVNDDMSCGGACIFVNKEGNRYVREDGRRDEMSLALIAQTDSIMYTIANAETFGVEDLHDCKTLAGQSVGYFLDNHLNGYVMGETLEEIAEQIGCPAENLIATVSAYNEHVLSGTKDEFGRVTYSKTLENGPYLAWPRSVAAHHTMGGVKIDTETHAISTDGSIIEGLYCAGEITGVVHGSNRVGGNAIDDYLTFGRIAGYNAAHGI